MARHLHLVPAGPDLDERSPEDADAPSRPESNVVDLDSERRRRRQPRLYHPSAGAHWLEELFDDDDDSLPPVC